MATFWERDLKSFSFGSPFVFFVISLFEIIGPCPTLVSRVRLWFSLHQFQGIAYLLITKLTVDSYNPKNAIH